MFDMECILISDFCCNGSTFDPAHTSIIIECMTLQIHELTPPLSLSTIIIYISFSPPLYLFSPPPPHLLLTSSPPPHLLLFYPPLPPLLPVLMAVILHSLYAQSSEYIRHVPCRHTSPVLSFVAMKQSSDPLGVTNTTLSYYCGGGALVFFLCLHICIIIYYRSGDLMGCKHVDSHS